MKNIRFKIARFKFNTFTIIGNWISFILWNIFGKSPQNYKNIPIIINNFNRLECLKKLINKLEKSGYKNIYIIDNNSSYPPLLAYYKTLSYHIFYLKENIGYLALWKTNIYKKFIRSYYVYTDPDVIPINECPDDFLEHFFKIMQQYKTVQKVGFGLRIDNLPDTYPQKQKVIEWEKHFFEKPLSTHVYKAQIDTTFALYRPFTGGEAHKYKFNIRTGMPYMAEHLPWYQNGELTEEDIYYKNHIQTSTHWSKQ
ncbi:glycosyltransferase family 2 protein [Phocaeicola plebeius]|uniref:glycosyltransferase family 2 protein n=1 Tax=Phocaeicola plebeius TaxID=310297 RepID=UPI0026F12681|nr:glycosyltransferase family 2 protein [Phocaeicola plebeius]